MGCINVREGEARAVIYALDECGNVATGAGNKLVIDTVAEIGWEESITDGDEVNERNFGGKKKYSDIGADEIDNIGVNLTLLGINPAVDTMLMGSTTKTYSGDVVGYGRTNLSSAVAVAIEVLIKLDADACTTGASASPIAGWFFPYVKNWRPSGGVTLNGTDLVKPPYTGKGYKNFNLDFNDTSDVDFSKWNGIYIPQTSATSDDGEWYASRLFSAAEYASLPTANCEPVAFAA